MLNKERALKWADALESGRYKQARRTLKKSCDGQESFCPLGVLCDVYAKENPTAAWLVSKLLSKEKEQIYIFNASEFSSDDVALPEIISDWIGEHAGYGNVFLDGDNVVNLNDNRMESFQQIAARIRKRVADESRESQKVD